MPPMTGSVRLACFDLGGVVIRICRSWTEGCAAAGLDVREPARWDEVKAARLALVHRHQVGRIDGTRFAQEISALWGGLYSPAEIMGIHRAWLLGEYEGIGDLIESVHRAGLETAALSNTCHEHWCRMGDYPAVMRIRHLLPSHQLGLQKPDPLIYRRAEQRLGYRGAEIIFFDDKIENVDAARDAGWHAEIIDPDGSTVPQITGALRARGVVL
jgi:putative hydrolase of the HAD superfamily